MRSTTDQRVDVTGILKSNLDRTIAPARILAAHASSSALVRIRPVAGASHDPGSAHARARGEGVRGHRGRLRTVTTTSVRSRSTPAAYRLTQRRRRRSALTQDHRPAPLSRCAAVDARDEGRAVQGALARRGGHRQRADPGGIGAPSGARRRSREADLHSDRRAARLQVHRSGNRAPCLRRRRVASTRSTSLRTSAAGDRGAGLRKRQRRSRAAPGCRRASPKP